MAKAPIDVRSLARVHTKAAIATLASIMYEPQCKPRDRISASEALLNRGWGNATQLVTQSDQGRVGFTEIKLVIIDAARDEPTQCLSDNARVIEHGDAQHDDTRPEPVLIEAKRQD